jgi:hypothetical protein
MRLPSLSLLVLRTTRMEPLRLFYTALGISFAEERHGTGPLHYAGRVGEAVLELYPLTDEKPFENVRLGLTVPDLNAALHALANIGVSPERPPAVTEWGLRAVVRDPDDRAVELLQAVNAAS